MPTPSLLIVPARFKTGKLYSQIPTSGAGDFTVTRNTAARRFNSAGLLESVASGIPRLDYATSGGTVGCPALLVEPAATNFAPNANLMNVLDTPTVSGGVTFTTGSTDFLAPDGTSASINKYVGGAASGTTQASRYSTTAITATASGIHIFSIFVKRGATNPLDFCAITPISFTGISPSPGRSFFNLASGTAITSGARIENYGNGWYRLISQPLTLSGDLIGGMVFELANTSGSISFATSGALNLTAYTWGAQFEAGSIATSYIPTTAGTGSRSADVISVSGAVSGSIGQTEGVLYIECESNDGEDDVFNINRSAANAITIYKNANNSYLGRIYHSPNPSIIFTSASGVTGTVKIAIAYKSGDSTMYLNGSRVGTLNTTAITFGAALNYLGVDKSSAFFSGIKPSRIRAVALYNTRLTDAELATLTTP
jgi:hypothetical protein